MFHKPMFPIAKAPHSGFTIATFALVVGLTGYALATTPPSVNFLDEYHCAQSGEYDGRELCEVWELTSR